MISPEKAFEMIGRQTVELAILREQVKMFKAQVLELQQEVDSLKADKADGKSESD